MSATSPELIARLDRAVQAGSVEAVTREVKSSLEDLLSSGAVQLPDRFRTVRPDTYARRLLYRDPAGRYTAIVMTWGPGQGTPVHDHGGLWCVEGVIEGQIEVTLYDVAPVDGERFVVTPGERLQAGIGAAGRLIPPTDYHVIVNALPTVPSLTLHVYGGEMAECRVFTPEIDGRYRAHVRQLAFHE